MVAVEGTKVLAELLEHGPPPQRLIYDLRAAAGEAVGDLVVAADRQGVPLEAVSPGVLDRLLDADTSQGVVGLVDRPAADPASLLDGHAGGVPLLIGAGVQDPGNVGTLVRIAAAAGGPGLLVDLNSADPWAPKALRASAGWALRHPVAEIDDAASAVNRLVEGGTMVVAAAPGGVPPEEIDWSGRTALVLGSEGQGVPSSVVAGCSQRVSIPMASGVESLNVAVAGAVVAFEAARQARILS
ncbi:MAG: RNA methyltransferase [Microthrixaceae bacterium]